MLTALQQSQHTFLKLQSPIEWLQPFAFSECNENIQSSSLLCGMQKHLRILQFLHEQPSCQHLEMGLGQVVCLPGRQPLQSLHCPEQNGFFVFIALRTATGQQVQL